MRFAAISTLTLLSLAGCSAPVDSPASTRDESSSALSLNLPPGGLWGKLVPVTPTIQFATQTAGRCLGVTATPVAGAPIVTVDCANSALQRFAPYPDRTLRMGADDSLCVGAFNDDFSLPLELLACDGSPGQQHWYYGGGRLAIGQLYRNAWDVCVTVDEFDSAPQAQSTVHATSCSLEKYPPLAQIFFPLNGPLTFARANPAAAFSLCMTSPATGAYPGLVPCAPSDANQQFTVSLSYEIMSRGQCLGLAGQHYNSDTTLDMQTCNGRLEQRWWPSVDTVNFWIGSSAIPPIVSYPTSYLDAGISVTASRGVYLNAYTLPAPEWDVRIALPGWWLWP
jgi:hypothetical protein